MNKMYDDAFLKAKAETLSSLSLVMFRTAYQIGQELISIDDYLSAQRAAGVHTLSLPTWLELHGFAISNVGGLMKAAAAATALNITAAQSHIIGTSRLIMLAQISDPAKLSSKYGQEDVAAVIKKALSRASIPALQDEVRRLRGKRSTGNNKTRQIQIYGFTDEQVKEVYVILDEESADRATALLSLLGIETGARSPQERLLSPRRSGESWRQSATAPRLLSRRSKTVGAGA